MMLDNVDKSLLLLTPGFIKQEQYWINKLKGDISKSELRPHSSHSRKHKKDRHLQTAREQVEILFPADLNARLLKISKKNSLTLYIIFLAALKALIFRYTNHEDIIVLAPVNKLKISNKTINNYVFIRDRVVGNISFKELLLRVKGSTLEAYDNQDYPSERLVDYLSQTAQIKSSKSISGILCSLDNIHHHEDIEQIESEIAFSFANKDGRVKGTVCCDTNIYDSHDAEHISSHFTRLLESSTEAIDLTIDDISFLSDREKERLIFDLNNTIAEYPKHKTLHGLFHDQVKRESAATAVVYRNTETGDIRLLNYSDLDIKSHRLAMMLRRVGVGDGDIVGMMLSRTEELVIGVLGILKADAVCLPVDLRYPGSRVVKILKDSRAKFLLKEEAREWDFPFEGIVIDSDSQERNRNAFTTGNIHESAHINTAAHSYAFAIYTSGSTGDPKGTLLRHFGVSNHIFTKIGILNLGQKDMMCHNFNAGFVASIWQLFAPLFIGAQLHIYPEEVINDPYKLFQNLERDHISVVEVVPSSLKAYLDVLDEGKKEIVLNKLRLLVLTGERVTPRLVNMWYRRYRIELLNAYGQTECSDDTLHYKIPYNPETIAVPIGSPSNNTQVYVLRNNGQLQPPGIPGELYIAGDGLAAGYLNRPELTAENFVFITYISQKLYKTGDLVRRLADNNIEFLGRVDHQVKIRGFRIEPAEIENHLLTHGEVKEAVVTARGGEENQFLCAYVVPRSPGLTKREISLNVSQLKDYLSGFLPDYMVPSHFIQLREIPVTSSGKVDRNALPESEVEEHKDQSGYIGPQDEIERKLLEIWSELLVLDKDAINIDDDFFKLGGNSLRIIVLAAKIHKAFDAKLELIEIFKTPTIKEIAKVIRNTAEDIHVSIETAEDRNYYPSSSAQKRLYVLQQLSPESTPYNMYQVLPLKGDIDRHKIEDTFRKLIDRHEVLRTSFLMIGAEPVQAVHSPADVSFALEYYERTAAPDTGYEYRYPTAVDFIRPFDLSRAPLLRVGLIKIDRTRYLLMVDMHHIVSDGTSLNIIRRDFMAFFAGDQLPPLRVQYKDYVHWQHSKGQEEARAQQEDYWLKKFGDIPPVLNLPTDYIRPVIQSFEGNKIRFEIPGDLLEKLNKTAESQNTTLFMILLAIYNILLTKLSGQEDIVVGTPSAGRRHSDLLNVVGMFVNTLALRNKPAGHKTLVEFLGEIKENSLKAFENQDYQFEDLVANVSVERDTSRNPIFDVMFSLMNQNEQRKYYAPEPGFFQQRETSVAEDGISKFDLTLGAVEAKDSLLCTFEYCTRLFKKETIQRFVNYLQEIILSVVHDPCREIAKIEILPGEEKNQILYGFNRTETGYPKDKTVQRLFEEQVERTPGAAAAVCRESHLTYGELNRRANCLAHLLRQKGVKRETIIGIMVDRSVELMTAIFGVMKVGGAYLPLDTNYPQERLDYILADSGASIILTDKPSGVPTGNRCRQVEIGGGHPYAGIRDNLETGVEAADPVYVFYTSGSTGWPKGVIVEHRSLVNFIKGMTDIIDFERDDTVLSLTTFSFDIFGLETIVPLTRGSRVVIASTDEQLDLEAVAAAVENNGATILQITPSRLSVLVSEAGFTKPLKSLKYLLVGGEAFPEQLAKKVQEIAAGKIYNLYGPTETTIWSTVKDVSRGESVNIGKPIANTRILILGKNRTIQPMGVVGELCIAGAGLARGYLNNQELTAEKFILQPYERGQRLYRTGDLVKWLPDGNIEFLGRIDHQIKVRGFRIELGEIENHLMAHPGIKKAVVTAKESQAGDKSLYAYVVPGETGGGSFLGDAAQLREFLSKKLPGYMIPSYFVQVEDIPLMPSGKIDKKVLNEMGYRLKSIADYEAPRNYIEEKLAEVWQEVLGIEKVGINDNLFQLGGDSVNAIQIAARVTKYNLKLKTIDLFLYPTIKAVENCVEKMQWEIDQSPIEGEVEPTPIQKWFFENNPSHLAHFFQSVLVYKEEGFDEEILKKVFTKIMEHHDALRMVYEIEENKVIQKNRDINGKLFDFKCIHFHDHPDTVIEIEREAGGIQRSIDAVKGPPVKLGLFKTGEGDYLLVVIHHLLVDEVSWYILLEDFAGGYRKLLEDQEIVFPKKTVSFQYWASKLKEFSKRSSVLKELNYWKELEEQEIETLSPDFEVTEGEKTLKNCVSVVLELNEEETERLLKKVNWVYNTEITDILLTALGLAVKDWAGIQTVLVDLERQARIPLVEDIDITRTVGCFTSRFPVLLDMHRSGDLSYLVPFIKEMLRRIPNNGIGYGLLKYLTPEELKKGFGNRLKPGLCFRYLGRFGREFDLNEDNGDKGTFSRISGMTIREYVTPGLANNYLLDINAVLKGAKLKLSFTYNRYEYNSSRIEKLLESYKANLVRIIEHCLEKEARELTPSDVGHNKMEIEDLRRIQQFINRQQ